ncbi:MAG: thymidine phosphorylase, partial [Lachnospiraceae bacterium]|nr:thymidine phosphorylase [Lachnospiraceae bacterium]
MRMYDLIEKKKMGEALTTEEIYHIVNGYTHDEIPDYQMSALLMAIYFKGMDVRERYDLTMAMRDSGDILDLSSIDGVKIDKHSTGGVGDKVTLVLGPIIASIGVPVAKMSGRGLGHTGGTIDKLEAFPGFNGALSEEQFVNQVNNIKIAVTGQSKNLAPADKKLYALRDVTATVDEISLITGSIMSKKLAAGTDAIVLDVTVGDGAFMKNKESALELAKSMVDIGKRANKKIAAVLTNMDEPLGFAVGNNLEVIEAIEALNGNGPEDLMEVVYELGSQMIVFSEIET